MPPSRDSSRRPRPPRPDAGGAAAAEGPRAPRTRAPRARAAAAPRDSALRLDRLIPSGRSLLIGFALLGTAIALYVAARQTSLVAVRELKVSGAPASVETRVRQALAPLVGASLVRVSPTDVAERLVPIPEVESVTIDRAFPHALKVRITTARRVAVLRQGKEAFVVSERGRILGTVAKRSFAGLPRIWVPTADDLSVGGTVGDQRTLSSVTAATAVFHGGLGGVGVRTIVAGDNELTYALRNGLEVRLGNLGQLPLKLALARKILALGGVQRYVDVSVPDRPVAGTTLPPNSQVEG